MNRNLHPDLRRRSRAFPTSSIRPARRLSIYVPVSFQVPPTFRFPILPSTFCLQISAAARSHNSFRMNTCKTVSKQRTLSAFRMTTYEKHRGGGQLWLTRNPMKGFCPERPSGAKDLSSTPTGKARLNPRDRGKKLAAAWVARPRSAGSRTLPPAGWRREATLRDSTALPAEGDRSEARWQQRKSG